MNRGPPIIELMTPTGRPFAPDTLATVSANNMNAAPNAAEAGMRYLLSEPTNILAT